jgi:tetratricopeptide (TPR) repeat protein
MRSFNAIKKQAMDECAKGGIEPRIKYLVNVFNSLPGICTTSSCGGHEMILNPTQSPADGFYIDFIVDIETGGMHSLDLITQMARITGGENIVIISWYTPSNRSVFTIEGEKNASPKKLAKALEIALLQIGRRNFIFSTKVDKPTFLNEKEKEILPDSGSEITEECKIKAISCKESGNSLYKQGNYQGALLFYEKGLRLDPNNPDLLHNKNMALAKLKK